MTSTPAPPPTASRKLRAHHVATVADAEVAQGQ